MYKTNTGLLTFNNPDGLIFSIAGFIAVLLFTSHSGLGMSPDAVGYLSVARNIITDGALIDYNFEPFVDFPVFYPFFLSITGFISGADLVAIGPYLNGFLFAAVIFTSGYLIDRFSFSTPWYKRVLLSCIVLSPSLLEIYSMLWSETLFILLLLLFIAVFNTYLQTRTLHHLLISGSIAAIACITRYAGITIIATGLMLLVFDPSLKLKKKMAHALLFGICAVSLLLVNLWHNASITGLMTGPRETGITPLGNNIAYYAGVISNWYPVPTADPVIISGLVIILLLVMTVVFLRRAYQAKTYAATENSFTAFFIVYTVFIIGISTLTHFEQINNRLLSPLFIPLLLALTSGFPWMITSLKRQRYRAVLVLMLLAAAVFQLNQLSRLSTMYRDYTDSGVPGYTDDSWKYSPIVSFLKKHPDVFEHKYGLYSNAHEAAYFNGGLRASSLPHKIDKKDIRDFFNKRGQYVIWFNQIDDAELIDMQQISKKAAVFKKYDFKDGTIYFVMPGH